MNGALTYKRERKPVPEGDWPTLQTEAAAIKYACERSGMQDKSIAIESNIDNALLSRAKSGDARLPFDALQALMDCTGCEAPLYAFLLRRGYDPRSLRKLESETERMLREEREKVAQLQHDNEVLIRALRGTPT